MKYIVEDKDVPCRLEDLLKSKWGFSKRFIRQMKSSPGALRINDKQAIVIDELTEGDHVQIQLPKEERSAHLIPENIPLLIIYEDEDLLILHKQAGIAMSPSAQHTSGTLANGIIYYYDLSNLPYTVHFVTRLDRDTSGIVVVAKHRHAHALLNNELIKGRLTRSYEAIVVGTLKNPSGIIDEPIHRKLGSIIERTVDPLGKKSITHYQVISKMKGYTHVSIQLETGRTHQIRVHFSHIGHPLVGDSLYGGDYTKMKQQALHCSSIELTHPLTKEVLRFTAPLRTDMDIFLTAQKKQVYPKRS